MDWTEPMLLERAFHIGADQVRVVARLGFPRVTEREDESACSFQLDGWKDSQIRVARGADGLQALTIASMAIRQWLDAASVVAASSDETPYEMVFPRYIPYCYGLDFHRHLCEMLDREVESTEQEIERRRGSRGESTS